AGGRPVLSGSGSTWQSSSASRRGQAKPQGRGRGRVRPKSGRGDSPRHPRAAGGYSDSDNTSRVSGNPRARPLPSGAAAIGRRRGR
ncbi:unnamed protein product, partial [Discosporangium mesarthrocarpum]